MSRTAQVQVRRVYDEPSASDGRRVLVDRIWPRGLATETAQIDEWCKDIAPSSELRKWYAHEPERFAEFVRRYRAELDDHERAAELARLRELADKHKVTLLTATRNISLSQAAVLADLIRR